MRIVHAANLYGPRSGGLRTAMHHLGAGYVAAGHDVTLLVPGASFDDALTPFGRRIVLPGPVIPGTGGYRMLVDLDRVRATLDQLAPDRLEVSDRFTLAGLGRWARRRDVRSVAFAHERLDRLMHRFLPPGPPWDRVADAANRRLAADFDTVVATTSFAGAEFARIAAPNLVRVPLGVDLETFRMDAYSASLRSALAGGATVLLVHAGRLSPEKRPERSVEALRRLVEAGVDARLVVAGTGPRAGALRRRARGLPVTFLGFVGRRSRLAEILAVADVALVPGPLETFGLAALEALAAGTPVVASASSALREIVAAGGLVVDDDPAAFAAGVMTLHERPERERRHAARAVAERYPWSTTVETMLRLHGAEIAAAASP